MPHYRIYTLTPDGHIGGPPRVVEARYDDEAIKQAKPFLGRADIEIWCGARLVRRFDPADRGEAELSSRPSTRGPLHSHS